MAPETERLRNEDWRAYRKTRWIAGLFYLVLWLAVLSICLVILGWATGFIDFLG
jgi:hypothetical protein